jgi:signal transduction histidine kinase/ligand-binding sensor domain-containing protein
MPRIVLPSAAPFAAMLLGVIAPAGLTARGAEAPADYSLREWHVQDGLPHDEVSSVRQDRAGYLWVATTGGLARFDGVHFDNYSAALAALPTSDAIRALTETDALGLVLAPESGGLLVQRDGTFRKAPFADGQRINALFAEADGTLWASCDDRTILRQHAGRTDTFGPAEIVNGRPVAYFASDGRKRMWVATGTFLASYEQGRLVPMKNDFGRSELRVASSRGNGPWIVTQDRVFKHDGERLDGGLPIPPLAGAHYIRALFEDRHGDLWLGTRSQGLFLISGGQCRPMPSSSEDILSICEDSEGDIWVATNGGGLDRLRRRDFRLFDKTAGLLDNFSYTVCEDDQGTIWFGNRDGGIARARDGVVDVLAPRPGWPQLSAMSVFPDGRGGLWVTGGTHVYKLDPGPPERLTRIEAVPSLSVIRVSYVARNGDLWIAIDPDKIGRLAGDRFELFGTAEGFDGRQARCISEDAKGRIWAGTADGKVFRFDGKRFGRVPLDPAENPVPIQAIYFEKNGVVWFGTAGHGLGALVDGTYRRVDQSDGLPDNSISQIIADDRGYLWFGSMRGIFCVPQKELADRLAGSLARIHPTIVGRDDGVKGISCLGIFQPAVWKSHDGKLWFATRKGVLTFDPAAAISDGAPPPVAIAEVKFDDRSRPLGESLEIPAGIRKLEFRFSVLRFSAPDRVQVKYRLDGFDSEWVVAGPDRLATYPALPPGPYRLQAIATLGNGGWSEQPRTLALTVIPRWWQTLAFRLLAIGGLVFAVAFVARAWSHRRLRGKLERLERESAIERERTRIARNIHDDLGASLTRISLLTQCAQPEGEAAGAARINHIYQTAGEIIRSMDEIVWAVDPRHDNLESLAGYLGNFAQNFLQVAGIRCRLSMPDRLPAMNLTSQMRHHLFLCFKEALNNVVKHAGADTVTVTISLAKQTLTIQVADNGNGPRPAPRDENRISAGRGLDNLRQRMAELGGRCSLTREAGRETVVTFAVELARSGPVTTAL